MRGVTPEAARDLVLRAESWLGSSMDGLGPVRGRASARHIESLVALLRAGSASPAWWSGVAEAQAIAAAIAAGASTEVHVPTLDGRTCDLVASRDGVRVWVHVKSLAPMATEASAPRRRAAREELLAALRPLERVERSVVVGVDAVAPLIVTRVDVDGAISFLRRAAIGDALLLRSLAGDVLGRLCVLAPWDGGHVAIAPGDVARPDAQRTRLERLVRKACHQFMPGETNLVAIAAACTDEQAIDWCLLGTPIERWDRFPRRGERTAYGRGDDGFWSSGREPQCRMAAWLAPWPSAGRVWLRCGASVMDRGSTADGRAPGVDLGAVRLAEDLCAEQALVQRDPGLTRGA